MKRVAIVYRTLAGLSGVPSVVFSQAQALTGLGYSVDLVAQKADPARVRAAGAGWARIRRAPGKNWNRRWFAHRADRLAGGYDFVIGHGHHCEQDVVIMHNCIRLANELTGCADGGGESDARLQDRVFGEGRFKLCVANSNLMRAELAGRYGVPEERIAVVYPGYDAARFNVPARERLRADARRALGVPENRLLFGLVTSGAFKKRGVDLLLDAYARLPQSGRDRTAVLIAGKSLLVDQLQAHARALGVADSVMFRPATDKVEDYYAALDIGVHPARFEEFGLSVVEMMACGLPVITNRQVGAAELLPAKAREQLPAQADAEALSAWLAYFIDNPESRRQWGEYGLAAARGNTAEANCRAILEVCRGVGL